MCNCYLSFFCVIFIFRQQLSLLEPCHYHMYFSLHMHINRDAHCPINVPSLYIFLLFLLFFFAIFINISFSVTYTLTKNFLLFWLAFLLSLSLVVHLLLCCIFKKRRLLVETGNCCAFLLHSFIVQLVAFATCHKLAKRKHKQSTKEKQLRIFIFLFFCWILFPSFSTRIFS